MLPRGARSKAFAVLSDGRYRPDIWRALQGSKTEHSFQADDCLSKLQEATKLARSDPGQIPEEGKEGYPQTS